MARVVFVGRAVYMSRASVLVVRGGVSLAGGVVAVGIGIFLGHNAEQLPLCWRR